MVSHRAVESRLYAQVCLIWGERQRRVRVYEEDLRDALALLELSDAQFEIVYKNFLTTILSAESYARIFIFVWNLAKGETTDAPPIGVENVAEGLHENEWGIVQQGSDNKYRRINLTQYTSGEAWTKATFLNRYHRNLIQHGVVNSRGEVSVVEFEGPLR